MLSVFEKPTADAGLAEHHVSQSVIMHHFVMQADLRVLAVDPVAYQDAAGKVVLFIEKKGDKITTAGAGRIDRERRVAFRAMDFNDSIMDEADIKTDPVLKAINRV